MTVPVRRPPLVLVGATATGKSVLAMELARVTGAEIVSMDSMQVYRGMDVGTAKPTATDRAEVPHHVIDVVDPHEDWSVARHQRAALDAVEVCAERDVPVVLVGGTGLYVQAVVDRLDLPGEYPEVRASLADDPDTEGLHRRLAELDPVAAGRMEPTNRRRVVRALEVTLGSGRPFSSFGPGLEAYPTSPFVQIGLDIDRDVLDRRIEERFVAQLEAGFVDEVASVWRREPSPSRTARQALGYEDLARHLAGEVSLDEAVAESVRKTRRFARRQLAWFRRDPRIRWFGFEAETGSLAAAVLEHWSATA